MTKADYEYLHQKRKRERIVKREFAMLKIANGSSPVCAICGCPHIEILQFGHFKGDGKSHRKEIGGSSRIIDWILRNSLKEVKERIQLECPYCNTWEAIFGEYPSEVKRPNWVHVKKENIVRFQTLLIDEEE